MNLSSIISITISLTFIYLVLSLAISEIQEIIASILNLRSKNLKKHIYGLFGEDPFEGGLQIGNFLQTFFNKNNKSDESKSQLLVEKLYAKYLKPACNPEAASSSKKSKQTLKEPDKISPKHFADNLIELIREELNYDNIDDFREHGLQNILQDIKKSSLPEKMKKDLVAITRKAMSRFEKTEDQLKLLDQEIQSWFNTSMEYASKVYRQQSVLISRILGVILVLILNVDTINIIDNLSKSEILSSTLGNTAMEFVTSNSQGTACSEIEDKVKFQTCIANVSNDLTTALDSIDNLPIGWNWSNPWQEQFTPLNLSNIINVIVGWGISVFAISMGAPFWFKVLNDLIDIRSKRSNSTQSNS